MNLMAAHGAGFEPFSQPARKIVLLADEDSFVLEHCRMLLGLLTDLGREVVIITRSTGRLGEFEALGASVIDFDCRVTWRNLAHDARSAWRLARILEAENADVLHFIGIGPAMLGGLALKLVAAGRVVVHLPELEPMVSAGGAWSPLYRPMARKLIASLVSRPRLVSAGGEPAGLGGLARGRH